MGIPGVHQFPGRVLELRPELRIAFVEGGDEGLRLGGMLSLGYMPARRMWTFTVRSCGACCPMLSCVARNAVTLMAISAKVTIGQRRADMFSCRIGMSIPLPCLHNLGGLPPSLGKGRDHAQITRDN